MNQIIIRVPDMQSAHCQARVSKAVKAIAGAEVQQVEAGVITVAYKSNKDDIIAAIEQAGYSVLPE
ncbi:MAG: heavy-metal-associated domain-containing protein [Chitinophagaceae bacterium]|nr:heavy-metal-associated domain-containing protein [Chitinophagaceae bacterium]